MKFTIIYLLSSALVRLSLGTDVCSLDPETGPCEALFQRYYFDSESKSCKSFNYGGCGGNENNFETQEECQKQCAPPSHPDSCGIDICHLEPDPGPCEALIQRYYFDAESRRCKKFFYGGCEGNENNFKSKRNCRKRCRRRKSRKA